jgi:hypothetical protein
MLPTTAPVIRISANTTIGNTNLLITAVISFRLVEPLPLMITSSIPEPTSPA